MALTCRRNDKTHGFKSPAPPLVSNKGNLYLNDLLLTRLLETSLSVHVYYPNPLSYKTYKVNLIWLETALCCTLCDHGLP